MSQTGPQASHLRHEPIGLCIPCTKPGCNHWFKNWLGHTQHMNAKHPMFLQQHGSTQPCRPPSPSSGLPGTTNLGDTGAMEFSDDENPMQPTVGFCSAGDQLYRNYHPLLSDHRHIYKTIDNTPLGDVKWQSFTVKYTGEIQEEGTAPWMADIHEVWFRDPREVVHNMLSNPDFAAEIDLRPYREFATENDERQWKDFMSGDWAYKQVDVISEDPDTHGSMFVPVILGRFLAMPKTTKQHAKTKGFQRFHRQLFHSSLSYILKSLKPGMMTPKVARFGDGHYRCIIYGLRPYIADYEEQVLLACIALDETTLLCSRFHADALIEECDFDTLWAEYGIVAVLVRYLLQEHGKTQANIILDDIDRWIAVVPPFPSLHQFLQGRHFKQWTGDDSKALMKCIKVYLPAIEGYVPEDVVHAFSTFLEFCYLIRHNILTEKSLEEIQAALAHFHQYHEVFKTTGTITMFLLPRQHSMTHYVHCIQLFGAPNGLCSLIMESKHIKAVKEPWRRSSQYNALGQMLLTNQHLDKLVASQVDFRTHGMLSDFFVDQLYPEMHLMEIPENIMDCPCYEGRIWVFNSTVLTFFTPSDLSSMGGMKREHIRVSPNWRNGCARKDCVFVITDPTAHGMQGMDVTRMGMWMVEPSSIDNHVHFAVIHVNLIFRSTHLIPVYGTEMLPAVIKSHHTLNIFTLFYVNKFTDHHAFEIAF
ncbi:uncharacterized protein EDB91DRAFT_1235710 [Suillus paluster]|uniref:uncharacterized protein n=1 Tax=Suillus paluster TaxID=48578 RepID=UPI001B8834DB|nr:uncharacterized protein EDB91DRAFT_1235710 [Suillus paluster]KAG1748366.1 hypothetical protein EDB91DRAFT_1235710 [Suillus paluster]